MRDGWWIARNQLTPSNPTAFGRSGSWLWHRSGCGWGKTRRVRKDRKTKMHLALPSIPGDWRPRLSILFESGVSECQPLLPAPSHLSVLNIHQAVCNPEFLHVKERPSFISSVFPSLSPRKPRFVKLPLVRRVACGVRQTFLLGSGF